MRPMPAAPRPRAFVILVLAALMLQSCSRGPSDFRRALQLEQDGRWEEALDGFSRALSRTQTTDTKKVADVYSHIGHCLIELGRGTEALGALEKALHLDTGNLNANLRMAQLYVVASAPEKAEPYLAYVEMVRPNDPEMLEVRALLLVAEDHSDLAERDLLRAYEISGHADRVAEYLSQLYLNEDKPDKARALLLRTIEHSPHKSSLLLTLGRLEELEGNTSGAEAAYRKAVALDDSAQTNQRLAQFLARNGDLSQAEDILRKVDQLTPAAPTAAGDLELAAGHPETALQDYEKQFRRILGSDRNVPSDPQPATALTVRIVETELTLAAAGDHSARAAAEKQLEDSRAYVDQATHSLLNAEIHLFAGDLPSAERQASEALSDNRDAAAAHYLLGQIAFRRGQHAEALNQWSISFQQDPNYVPARLSLAADAVDKHDGAKAEEYVIDVVRDEPANLSALLLYARALVLQKRYDTATTLCQRAQAAAPASADPAIALGDIALEQHQLARALLQYEKAILLQANSEEAIKGLTAVYEKGGVNLAMLRKLEKLSESGTPSSRLLEITGRLYASRGMMSDATRCLRRAVQMDPKRFSATLALAGAYASHEQSVSDLLANPDLKTLKSSGQSSTSFIAAALDADHRGDIAEAIRDYESAVRTGDVTGIASNNLAWIYATRGQNLVHARKLAEQALAINPGSPQVLDTLGVIQLESRQFTEAIASFQRGVRRASELQGMEDLQRTIQAHLAEAQQLSGQPATSR